MTDAQDANWKISRKYRLPFKSICLQWQLPFLQQQANSHFQKVGRVTA
jgi:hypothetical protein